MDRLKTVWTHLRLSFSEKPAAEVRGKDVVRYTAARQAAGAADGTINREIATLKAAMRHGAREGTIDRVPMFPKRLKESPPRQGFIVPEQYERLAANADELWLRTFLALGFTYGCRKGELLALRIRNADLLDKWLTIEHSKNGEGRKIKLTQESLELLVECCRGKGPDDFLLTREDGEDGTHVAQPRKAWYALCCRAGLGKFTSGRYAGLQMHDLRRSAVRQMVRKGIPEKTCMKISGHKTRSVFDHYNITNERDLEEAARKLEIPFETWEKTDTRKFAHS